MALSAPGARSTNLWANSKCRSGSRSCQDGDVDLYLTGSDAGAPKTRAEVRDGQWVINGAKQFITNCGTDISAGVTVTAVTGKSNGGHAEISALMIPTGTPGYHVLASYRKLGWHSSDTHPLCFDDCPVPKEKLPRAHGGGYRPFL